MRSAPFGILFAESGRVQLKIKARDAVWQAQKAGDLPPDALARRNDLTPQARASLQLMRATWLLKSLAARLDVPPGAADRPAIAIVLMGPMLAEFNPRDLTNTAWALHALGCAGPALVERIGSCACARACAHAA
jgi:hypothetical protein